MSLELVKRVRQRIVDLEGESGLAGPCGAFKVVAGVVAELRAAGDTDAGFIFKQPEQNNCRGRGVDIVMWPNGAIVDILGDGGGENIPIWQPKGVVASSLYRRDAGPDGSTGGVSDRPGRAEMMRALEVLHEFYKAPEGLQRPQGLWIDGHPDFEGIGTWLFDVYFGQRLAGFPPELAAAEVRRQIEASDEWKTKHR